MRADNHVRTNVSSVSDHYCVPVKMTEDPSQNLKDLGLRVGRATRTLCLRLETWEFLETELLPLVSVNGAPRRSSSERAALSPTPSRECGASGARDPTHTHSHLVTYTLSTHQSQLPGFGITVLHEDAGSIPGDDIRPFVPFYFSGLFIIINNMHI